MLDDVRDELGLPPTTRLRAELHAMLIYGKGQFFLPHQDSEKDDAMVGTLVVSLPSAHAGGELIVEHSGESVTYRTSKQDLSFVAFYADCRHEVKPVTSGYRVTLTFNLLADGEADAQGSGLAADLARCLTEHFATPAAPRYGRTDLDPPNRLVYLLDHEYTQFAGDAPIDLLNDGFYSSEFDSVVTADFIWDIGRWTTTVHGTR